MILCSFFRPPDALLLNGQLWMAATNKTGSLFIMIILGFVNGHYFVIIHTYTKQSHTMQTVRFDRILKIIAFHTHTHSHTSSLPNSVNCHAYSSSFVSTILFLFSKLTAFILQETFVCIPKYSSLKWFPFDLNQIVLVITVCSPWRSSTANNENDQIMHGQHFKQIQTKECVNFPVNCTN